MVGVQEVYWPLLLGTLDLILAGKMKQPDATYPCAFTRASEAAARVIWEKNILQERRRQQETNEKSFNPLEVMATILRPEDGVCFCDWCNEQRFSDEASGVDEDFNAVQAR